MESNLKAKGQAAQGAVAATATAPRASSELRMWLLRALAGAGVLLALHALQILLPRFFNDYVLDIIMLAGINIMLAVSLNLINGITGQFSLGHVGFMGLGAYAAASFTLYAGPLLLLPLWAIFALSLLLGALAAGVAGLLVGLPSLRLRGDYLAIVTLGFGLMIIGIIQTVEELGAALGMSDAPTDPASGALNLEFQRGVETNFVWLFALVFLCVLSVRNIADSTPGRAMRAVREDEVAAEAVGVDTTRMKVLAFVVSAMWAGVAGALYAHYKHFVTPSDYDFVRSVEVVVMVVLGGLGSISGAAIAAVLVRVMEAALRSVGGTFWVGVALIVLAAALSFPQHRAAIKQGAAGWLRWLGGSAVAMLGLVLLFRFGRGAIETESTPGNAEPWLRYVIYALILIVLMLLRPQGLLGRAELSFGSLRRRASNDRSDAGQTPRGQEGDPEIADAVTERSAPADEGVRGTL